jgi:hypothetical protein
MNKELEKAVEKYVEDFDLSFYNTVEEIPVKEFGKKDFIEGAKWQAKIMYSEEEVKQIIEATLIQYSDYLLADIPEWFEQFSKLKDG